MSYSLTGAGLKQLRAADTKEASSEQEGASLMPTEWQYQRLRRNLDDVVDGQEGDSAQLRQQASDRIDRDSSIHDIADMRIWSSGQLTDEIDPADASEKFEMHMKRLRHAQGLLTDAGSVPGKVFDALEGLTNKYFHKPMPKVELRQYEKAWRARKGMVGSDERLEDFKRGAAVKRIIHNHFLGDFWEIYQNAHRSRQGTLVNGFEPKTWHRLSGAAYREHIEKEQKRKAELSEIVGKTRAQIVGKAGPASVGNMAGGPDAATSGAVSASAALIASSAAGGGSAISVPIIARIMLTMTHKHPSDAREFIKEWEAKNLATPLDRTKNMLDQAVEILQRNPAVTCVPRTSHEMLVLQEVLRPLPAFRRIADFVFAEICRLLVCDVLNDGEFIFKQGDIGTRWYVVLSGRVRIMINKPGFTSSDEEPERSLATVLGAGEAFGDHALVNDVPRVASAISDGRTVVARLEKSDFKRLMSLVHTLEQKELVYFLQKIPMLRELDQLGLRNIADRMTMRVLAPGTIVIREGEFKESVMFVRSGMCAVFREVTFSEPDGSETRRQLLLGHIGAYESFNEEPAVVKIGTHAGSPFTVVAVDWVELGAVFAYGEWTNMALTYVPSPFAMLTNKDMARAFRVRHEMRRFSRFQRRLVADAPPPPHHPAQSFAPESGHAPRGGAGNKVPAAADVAALPAGPTFEQWQLEALERWFASAPAPSLAVIEERTLLVGLSAEQIAAWFAHRRQAAGIAAAPAEAAATAADAPEAVSERPTPAALALGGVSDAQSAATPSAPDAGLIAAQGLTPTALHLLAAARSASNESPRVPPTPPTAAAQISARNGLQWSPTSDSVGSPESALSPASTENDDVPSSPLSLADVLGVGVKSMSDPAQIPRMELLMAQQRFEPAQIEILNVIESTSQHHVLEAFAASKGLSIIKRWLDEAVKHRSPVLIPALRALERLPLQLHHLSDSKIGRTVKRMTKTDAALGKDALELANALFSRWSKLISQKSQAGSGASSTKVAVPEAVETDSSERKRQHHELDGTKTVLGSSKRIAVVVPKLRKQPAAGIHAHSTLAAASAKSGDNRRPPVVSSPAEESKPAVASAHASFFSQLAGRPSVPAANVARPAVAKPLAQTVKPAKQSVDNVLKRRASDGGTHENSLEPPTKMKATFNGSPTEDRAVPSYRKMADSVSSSSVATAKSPGTAAAACTSSTSPIADVLLGVQPPASTHAPSYRRRPDPAVSEGGAASSRETTSPTTANLAVEADAVGVSGQSKTKQKNVRFKPDDQLCEIKYFETPEPENPSAHRAMSAHDRSKTREFDRSEAKHAFESLRRELCEQISWSTPRPIRLFSDVVMVESAEAKSQETRERLALSRVFYSLADIPPTPDEPDGADSMQGIQDEQVKLVKLDSESTRQILMMSNLSRTMTPAATPTAALPINAPAPLSVAAVTAPISLSAPASASLPGLAALPTSIPSLGLPSGPQLYQPPVQTSPPSTLSQQLNPQLLGQALTLLGLVSAQGQSGLTGLTGVVSDLAALASQQAQPPAQTAPYALPPFVPAVQHPVQHPVPALADDPRGGGHALTNQQQHQQQQPYGFYAAHGSQPSQTPSAHAPLRQQQQKQQQHKPSQQHSHLHQSQQQVPYRTGFPRPNPRDQRKTKMCMFWKSGTCRNGANCKFLHQDIN
ncbi:hypothetical protein HK105_201509 [Polyrhizophydium stewartii]|uniref:Uncharacterized protein n=1 Tax=Polyrhizophydium stewartii TaxID=2732419 RepID=A0ABR4NGT7_9FUNG